MLSVLSPTMRPPTIRPGTAAPGSITPDSCNSGEPFGVFTVPELR